MSPTSHRFARAGLALAAVVAVTSTFAASAGAAPSAQADGTKLVSYRGYQVAVPKAWPVVDLAQQKVCVRFDKPAVYLGTPAYQETCPATLSGRAAGLLIEPLNGQSAGRPGIVRARTGTAVAPQATSASGTVQVAVERAGVLVTAAHGPSNEQAVRRILATGKIVSGAKATTLDKASKANVVVGPTAAVVAPGTFLGKGFDQCAAPSQGAMDAWWSSSPYKAVGIYISGIQRACGQPNLTSTWITNQHNRGWKFLPLHVGLQAPCWARPTGHKMSSDPATARNQGRQAAVESVNAAGALGIVAGSVLYNDIENYPRGGSCTVAVMSFLAGWTDELHARGYLSGVYSSASSGIADLVQYYNNSSYTRPDHVFFARWDNVVTTNDPVIPASYWANHQRIKQYAGDVTETWGGVTIAIDRDYFDTANGGPPPPCASVSLDATAYPNQQVGSTGNLVKAAQCLLQASGHLPAGQPSGTFDAATESAVRAFQTSKSLAVTGVVNSRTWTALLSRGTTPTLRNGSSGADVSRLQRSLTAALGRTVGIDGAFGPITEQAVRDYQSTRSLGVDGIVGAQTWGALQAGR